MKKLMIVAAAAAMVGGAFADTAYTFNATLKTTVGKSGKSTATYNLGKDDADNFWYDDVVVTALRTNPAYSAYFTTKRVGGTPVPALSSKAKKDNEWLLTNLVALAATYDNKSANKWCDSFKVTDEGCYRVSGTKKIKEIFTGDICCEALVGEDGLTVDATVSLDGVQRFGGLTYASAKKVEIFAELAADDLEEPFYLAGQGSVGKVLDSADLTTAVEGVTSISGNIVGVLEAPECESCCAPGQASGAFVCTGDDDGTFDTELMTAAYGTFSIKYNAKETKELAD